MEILKFDGSETPSSRKRSGRGAILVTFVALVFGAGTALASGTLTINGTNTIALDQGVANSVQCDTNLNVSLSTNYETSTANFIFAGVSISDISNDCSGNIFTIKTYGQDGSMQVFCNATNDTGCQPGGKSSKLTVSGATLVYEFTQGLPTGIPGFVNVKHVTVESSNP
jgi:hypothetical protein